MKGLFLAGLVTMLCATAIAQNLDQTTVTDQLNTGVRGNAIGGRGVGTPYWGASKIDGTDYLDYSGSDATGTPIRYVNSYAGGSGSNDTTNGESPVLTVTAAHLQPDRGTSTIPAIAANNRPGATDGSKAIVISDDGGMNGLYFGQSSNANYFVQADVFCFDKSAEFVTAPTTYETAMVTARNARDNDTSVTDYTFNPDREGSYCIWADYQKREIKCGKWTVGNAGADILARLASTYTQFGSTIPYTSEAWHTFRIECEGTNIRFIVDGTTVASVTDTSFSNGRPGLAYREAIVASAAERGAHFDNLVAGPTTAAVSAVNDWSLFN